jgi:hypothetical protein
MLNGAGGRGADSEKVEIGNIYYLYMLSNVTVSQPSLVHSPCF